MILLKWSKTISASNQVKLIIVPTIPNSSPSPVVALVNSLYPLFQCKVAQEWFSLTDSRVRRHFDVILSRLHLNNTSYAPHASRRSGATFPFNNEVAFAEYSES